MAVGEARATVRESEEVAARQALAMLLPIPARLLPKKGKEEEGEVVWWGLVGIPISPPQYVLCLGRWVEGSGIHGESATSVIGGGEGEGVFRPLCDQTTESFDIVRGGVCALRPVVRGTGRTPQDPARAFSVCLHLPLLPVHSLCEGANRPAKWDPMWRGGGWGLKWCWIHGFGYNKRRAQSHGWTGFSRLRIRK